jgi:hypothetical protein
MYLFHWHVVRFRNALNELNELVSSIDVSNEFRRHVESCLDSLSIVANENLSQTEIYYISLLKQREQLIARLKI